MQMDGRATASQGALQMITVGDLGRAEREFGPDPAAARFRFERSARVSWQQQADVAAGGFQADAAVRPQLRPYAASRGARIHLPVGVLDADAASRGVQVEVPGRMRHIYGSARRAQIRRTIEPLRLDAAAGGMRLDRAGDILEADAAA